jgi:hypothetical protein
VHKNITTTTLENLHKCGINYKESSGIHEPKRKENKHISLSPWSREAGYNSNTTLLQGITKIGTLRAMNNKIRGLHDLPTHVPKKSAEGKICRPPHKLLHAGIIFRL